MNKVRVNKRGADRVRHGHLWIYSSDIVDVEAEGGSIVCVKDEGGNFIGQALFSDASQIAPNGGRRLTVNCFAAHRQAPDSTPRSPTTTLLG